MGEILEGELLERVLELKRIKNLRRARKLDEAQEEVFKYVEKYPDDYYGLFTAGRILSANHYYHKAKEFLLKVANSDSPNRFSACSTLGEIAIKENNIDQAIAYYEKAIFDNPNVETIAIVSLTDILINKKKYDEALKLISLVEKTSPDYYNAAIAEIFSCKKQFNEAKEYIDKISPTGFIWFDRKVYLRKAIINKHLHNYDEAFDYLSKLENKNDIYYRRGLIEQADIYFELKDYDKCYEICQKCNQDNAKVNYLLGRLNEHFGNIKEAKDYYLLATKSESDSIIRDNSHHLGDIFCEEGDYAKALECYKLAIAKSRIFPRTIYFKVIGVLIKTKEYQKAYDYLLDMKEIYKEIEQNALYRTVRTYLNKMLGKEVSLVNLYYKEDMIVSYNKERALEHIRSNNDKSHNKFSPSNSIEDIYFYAQNNLLKSSKVETRTLDTYDIYMSDVGYRDAEFTSKLRVITVPHTNLILDMYPCFEETLKDKINNQNLQYQKNKSHS